ncbi:MAG: 3-methyl-2-oxobutanoate dehydrogenase subunit beta, partial [Breznakiellaceae bacterium]
GTAARVCLGAKKLADAAGLRVGLFRPITLWPFPEKALAQLARRGQPFLTVEMSMGQMVEDVKLSVLGQAPVHLLDHCGGVIPTEEEVFEEAKRLLGRG